MTNPSELAVLTRHFQADTAGERMGWVNMHNLNEDTSRAQVLTARVGAASTIRSTRLQQGESDSYVVQTAEGFSDFRTFDILLWHDEEDENSRNSLVQEITTQPTREGHVTTGIWGGEETAVPPNWAVDKRGVVQLIKGGLERIGKAEFYLEVYYGLNGGLAHPSIPGLEDLEPEGRKALFYPDPSMVDTTRGLIGQAVAVEFALNSESLEDFAVLGELSVAGAMDPLELPGMFSASRKEVARLERVIREAVKDSPFKDFVFKPVGYRRQRPYIDPTDPMDSIRLEVQQALSKRNEKPAIEELDRERQELRYRIAYARAGLQTLKGLLAAEIEAAA